MTAAAISGSRPVPPVTWPSIGAIHFFTGAGGFAVVGGAVCAGLLLLVSRACRYAQGMHRPGIDPDHVQLSDVLCDFCHTPWREDLPVVEGHRGSIICGECLTQAYREVVLGVTGLGGGDAAPGYTCTMCLEQRPDRAWQGRAQPTATVCARCIRQSAGVLHKDKDYPWQKPTA